MPDEANGSAPAEADNKALMKKIRIAAVPVLLVAGAYGYFNRSSVDCGSSGAKAAVIQIAKEHKLLQSVIRNQSNGPNVAKDTSCEQDSACAKVNGEYQAALAAAKDLATQCLAIPAQEGFDECPEFSEHGQNFTTNAPDHWGTSLPDQNGDLKYSSARKSLMDAKAPALFDRLNAADKARTAAEKALQTANFQRTATAWDQAVDSLEYALSQIVTIDKNEQTGAVACKATLTGTVAGWGDKSTSVRYSIEKTSDGELYATLYGGR